MAAGIPTVPQPCVVEVSLQQLRLLLAAEARESMTRRHHHELEWAGWYAIQHLGFLGQCWVSVPKHGLLVSPRVISELQYSKIKNADQCQNLNKIHLHLVVPAQHRWQQ